MKKPVDRYRVLCAAVSAFLFLCTACSGNASKTPTTIPATTHTTALATENTSAETADPSSESTTDTTSESATETTTDPTEKHVSSMDLTLATFNIKHGAEGLDKISEAILDISPDIIGLEEVDVMCERSGNIDEPAELARLAGYPYYAFSKAISLGAGEYGTAILSRYPIESFEIISLYSGNGEDRSVGHAVISVPDLSPLKLDVFVTHLSYENRSLRITQMETIAEQLAMCDHYILFGDLNSFNLEDISYLGGAYYVNRPDRSYITFLRRELAIDNIVVSRDFSELSSGVSDAECSDHKLLYAVFHFNAE
ncbi:MAG: endonuclease/exonuclease/phosphatase family protein [Eubacterium sp.]|nr:endonuclease/exonuclease/phosphatase family protein [Eubacterium sp.]